MITSLHYDLSTDTNLGGENASDYIIPSEKAIKTYVDNNSGGGGSSTLSGLSDVSLSSPTSGEVLGYNGMAWTNVQRTLVTFRDWSVS